MIDGVRIWGALILHICILLTKVDLKAVLVTVVGGGGCVAVYGGPSGAPRALGLCKFGEVCKPPLRFGHG